jgi:hypothetical protein
MGALEILIVLFGFALLLVFLICGIEFAIGMEDRQKRKAEQLRSRRDAKQKELDTLRLEHARIKTMLQQIEDSAVVETTVSNNIYAHSVLDTIRKEK